jgi:transketolase
MKNELREIRDGFGDGLVNAGRADPNVWTLSADLASSVKLDGFAREFPGRFVECGIAEANMIDVASGLAAVGKIPFAGSFAMFSPGRNWEQVRTTVCLNDRNVKIISTHAGFSDASDGATHQALEDIALMRVLPNMVVLSPADYNEARTMATAVAKDPRPTYIRIERGAFPAIFPENIEFKIGPARILKTTDPRRKSVVIFTTGSMAASCLDAAARLASKNIAAAVIHFPTIKPLDKATVWDAARKYGRVVTVENHQRAGGFGSAVAEVLSEYLPTPVLRLGAKDALGESGTYAELLRKHGLDVGGIVRSVEKFVAG